MPTGTVKSQRSIDELTNLIANRVRNTGNNDDCSVSIDFTTNHNLIELMSNKNTKTASYIEYGRDHGTLNMLERYIDPVSLRVNADEGHAWATTRITNLTLLKTILAANDLTITSNYFEFEIVVASGWEKQYSSHYENIVTRLYTSFLIGVKKVTGLNML